MNITQQSLLLAVTTLPVNALESSACTQPIVNRVGALYFDILSNNLQEERSHHDNGGNL